MPFWDRLFGKKKEAMRPAPTPPRGQGGGMAIPPGFEADIVELQRLQAQRQQDPRVIGRLIQVYECILGRLRSDKYPVFRAAIQNDLGIAYAQLTTGDRGANLAQAIACYQQALRFWTSETAPFEYARTQYNLGNSYNDLLTGDRLISVGFFMSHLHTLVMVSYQWRWARRARVLGNRGRGVTADD